ncbi:cytochrome P450 4C1-like [Macrosteles quadrilineatus]|uniref:cytochrome P450 4C1-like n=1 Tax=Macrosteles quadrilineatus TaxID=74068 RepID=UPI0023E25C85|nr:cytochrome P450 4C1-like [Macrosteles quadrilineatus]
MIAELVIFIIFLVLLRLFVFKSRTERMLEKLPGPKGYPIIGNLLDFDYPRTEVTETMKQLSFKFGSVFCFKLGFDPIIGLRNPSDIELVLGSTSIIDKGPLYWPLYPWLNQGLLTSGGEKWRKHRKILTPAFHFKVLENFVPLFGKHAQVLTKKLLTLTDIEVDIMPIIALCALDVISETAMGLEINAQLKESKYVKAVNELQEIMAHRNFDFLQRSFLFPLLPSGRRHDQLIAYLHSVTEDVMKERKAKLLDTLPSQEEESFEDKEMGIKKKKVFLDLLLQYNSEGAGMTDDEIRDEVDTFMFEGYDTTTSTTSFCLYALSQNPNVQERALEELKTIFGDSEREATFQDLQEMKYLDKVIKETLRRYPTVQFIARKSSDDLLLNSGYTLPKDISIMVLIEAMNHDPDVYPDPMNFDPDRFDQKAANPYTFVPFSAGVRNCIGQKYAMLEVKSVVSNILRRFRLLPSDVPITPWFNIVLKSKTGVYLKLESRNI